MKRVLVITYYWPPAGGSGVQRWLKFSKFLPQYGWQPVIYTPENPDMPVTDESLLADIDVRTEILKTPIREPYGIYRSMFGIRKDKAAGTRVHGKGGGFKSWLTNVIRANLFIPDPRRVWVSSSVNYLREYLRNHPVDVIVSTGPPHSMHLIARKLVEKIPCAWIADFRDPWTGMFYFKHLKMLPFVRGMHRRMEADVLRKADAVIVVSDRMRTDFLKVSGVDPDKVSVITNGFDPDDFVRVDEAPSDKFTLVHTGLMVRDGNPEYVWLALSEMLREIDGFSSALRIRLIGETDDYVLDSVRNAGLGDYLEHVPYIPHKDIVLEQDRASVLLLPLRNEPEAGAILTGKFFEYLASGRPVLAIGPCDGDLAAVLEKCQAGEIYDFSDKEGVKKALVARYRDFVSGRLNSNNENENINAYSRRSLTGVLVEKMNMLE